MSECECLVLGPEGTGKTLLLKKLRNSVTQKKTSTNEPHEPAEPPTSIKDDCTDLTKGLIHTLPTAGTNIDKLQFAKGLVCTLRECGASVAPLWGSYYKHCNMVVYVVDLTNKTQISAATMLLLDVLSAKDLEHKPVLILFNKTESKHCMSLTELKSIMRLDDIIEYSLCPLKVAECSCVTEEGLDSVSEWIRENTKAVKVKR